MTTRAIIDTAGLTALEDCETRIKTAVRRTLDSTCAVAREMNKIEEQELYKAAGFETFKEYLAGRSKIEEKTYYRIQKVLQTVEEFKESGLELPTTDAHVLELSRLDTPRRNALWQDILINQDPDKPLTTDDIKRAVDSVVYLPPQTAPAKKPLEIDMEDSPNGDEPAKPRKPQAKVEEAALSLTEKGEAALARIRKVIGDPEADAIEQGIKVMTEREIKGWADCDDDKMRDLRFYIMDQNWPLSKAISFSEKQVEDSTDVSELVMIARSRNGFANFPVKGATITVKIT